MIRVALVLVVCARIAQADARLDESGPCSGVRERVAALVGRDPFVAMAATTIAVATAASASGASGSLFVAVAGRPAGHRALHAASCAALVDDLALAIAVVLASPPPEAEPPIADAPGDGETPPTPPPDKLASVDATLGEGATSAWQLAMIGGAAASSRGASAVALGLRVKHGPLSLAAGLVLASPEEIAVAPGIVHISRGELSLLPCVHAGRGFACADLSAGWISGSGSGFAASATAAMPYAAAGLRLALEQPVAPWFAVQAFAEGRIALTSNRFFVDDMAVWTGSRLEAWLGIGVVAHIP